ncbi:plasmid partition protein [Streptantibioticus rubrisoli]|uniref:Plasmid partition protein n=1 Tax=Streptantibioticus rubrisoli TaxID=1387313 RepID=A0ABT1PNF8_9ACTN|nr:plasmid partition protein [Streptantibioticus rubrisoli]MCQ4045810.1 plasmid partition protein [Streptantibioticus rubrisoli]
MLIANVSPRTMAKTTDTAWLAHALAEDEEQYEVEGFDADHSKQFYNWGKEEKGDFQFPVHLAASAQFHKEVVPPTGKSIGMVDCGHAENHPHITDSVLRVADLVILHMSPTGADWERIVEPPDATPFMDILKRSAPLRATKRMPTTWVLLNRTVANASSTGYYREEMAKEGYDVFTTVIPRSELFGQSLGFPILDARKTAFGALVTEMKMRGLLPVTKQKEQEAK